MAAPAVLFPWSDEYSVKIAVVDSQHKKLLSLTNDLHAAMTAGRGRAQLGQVLTGLLDYTRAHFAAEEGLMQSNGYEGYFSHKREHERLTDRIQAYQDKVLSGEVGLSIEVMSFLKDWLIKHILGWDKKYAPFLNAKGVF